MSDYEDLEEQLLKLQAGEQLGVQPEPEPVAEPEEEEELPAEPEPQPAPVLDETPTYATVEDIGKMRAQMEVHQRRTEEALAHFMRAAQQQQQQYQPQQPPQFEDPALIALNQQRNEYLQYTQRMQAEIRSLQLENQRSAMNGAIRELTSKYPDFHSVIKPQEVEAAFNQAAAQGVQVPWTQHLEQNYFIRNFPKMQAELQAQKDELEKRRSQKASKAQEVTKASSVPTGGNPYQQPQYVPNKSDRGWDGAFTEALARIQQGG